MQPPFDYSTASPYQWTTPENTAALEAETREAFETAGAPDTLPERPKDIPLNEQPEEKAEELKKRLSGIGPLTEELENRIEFIKIDSSIEQHFINVTGEPPPDTQSDLENLIFAHDYAFAGNKTLSNDEKIEGYPGSPLIVAFFVEKAMGQNVTAKSLQDDLENFGVFRTLETCKLIEALAGHYIRNYINFKDGLNPKEVLLPDTKIPEDHIK